MIVCSVCSGVGSCMKMVFCTILLVAVLGMLCLSPAWREAGASLQRPDCPVCRLQGSQWWVLLLPCAGEGSLKSR